MRSMTGYGQAQLEQGGLRVAARVRTVNHRQLDLVLRMPDELRPMEAEVRDCLRAELRRGRVEARLELTHLGERPSRVELARGAVAALREAADALDSEGLASRELRFADLLRLPEVVRLSFEPHAWSDEDRDLVLRAAAAACDQAVSARSAEGERLAAVLAGHLDELAELQAEIAAGAPEARERLAQEIALLVERSDVREELDRLAAHLEAARGLLASKEPVGRRLEFLAQEMLREINTLGAKCRDLPLTRAVLDAKAVCDRLREQVLNIE